MHASAMFYGKTFFEVYCSGHLPEGFTVVEIGSQDVNGSLRQVAPEGARYIGLDFIEGAGVDVIIEDPYKIPLPDAWADIVVSSSCFEHSEFFWLTFVEIIRILKPGGFVYVNVPSNGMYHRYPVDCWRFYPDSGEALAGWARRVGFQVNLIESFVGARSEENIWNDFVAVFQKKTDQQCCFTETILDRISGYTNARTQSTQLGTVMNFSEFSYEYKKIVSLREALSEGEGQITNLKTLLSKRDAQIDEIYNSNSWRITWPLRWVGAQGKCIRRACSRAWCFIKSSLGH